MKIGKRPARILLYEQVVEDLCLLIDRGDFEPGDQLPSERELIEKLNVSRNVLREAFHVLESRGVIVSAIGSAKKTSIAEPDKIRGKIKINGISKIILRHIVRKIAFFA